MKITRDSAILYVGAAVALVGYLSQAKIPTEWHYGDVLQFASFALAYVMGKLGTSPLKGEWDK